MGRSLPLCWDVFCGSREECLSDVLCGSREGCLWDVLCRFVGTFSAALVRSACAVFLPL